MLKQNKRSWQLLNNISILDYADSPRTSKHISKGKLSTKNIVKSSIELDLDDRLPRNYIKPPPQLMEDHVYNDYQLDIWFLISEHIPPEDVCQFALICQKTRYVVSTAKFWFYLYRKYFDWNIQLPTRLQPECMVRLGSLRACVIRSLFYMYPPFIQRTRNPPDLDSLLKLKCMGAWYGRTEDYWTLCFKFSKKTRHKLVLTEEINDWESNADFITAFTDINENSEEGNRLLVIITDRFYPPPEFMGPELYLSKIIQPLSQNLRTFKLEMKFTEYNGKPVGTVCYDPMKQCKVLRWWEPKYYSYLS